MARVRKLGNKKMHEKNVCAFEIVYEKNKFGPSERKPSVGVKEGSQTESDTAGRESSS